MIKDDFSLKMKIQPIYNPKEAKLFGYECLMGIVGAETGELNAADFMPTAHKYPAFMRHFDEWTIGTVMRSNAEFVRRGAECPLLTFNVDDSTFNEKDFLLDTFDKYAESDKYDLNYVGIEVPARVLTSGKTADVILELRSLGIKFVVDNINSGEIEESFYAADILKIPYTITRFVGKSAEANKFAGRIIDFAKKIGISACAVGVERPDQEKYLLGIGCELMQGFYYSKPMERRDLIRG